MEMMMNMDDDARGLLCSFECEIPIRYIHPDMTLTTGEITDIGDENLRGLIATKKLHLVLDLDHTLIHSINYFNLTVDEKKLVESFDDAYQFTCETSKFVMKLRPGIREFLQEVSSMFDVSVYTMGTRRYAKEVHSLLVSKAGFPKGSWVISKEDSVKPKTKRLDVVLSHERVVLIVDDTEHVWGRKCMLNLVRIGRYVFNPVKTSVGVDTELERVLKILKGVHNEFFYGRFVSDYLTRDVRPMLRWISLNLDGLKPCTIDYKSNEDHRMVFGSSGSGVDRQKRARDDGESVDGCVENSLSDVPIKRCNTTVVEGSSSDNEPVLPCNEMQESPNTRVVSLDCSAEVTPNTTSVVSLDCAPNTSVVSIDCIEETPNTTSVVLLDCAPNTSVVSIDCTEETPNTSVVSIDCIEETPNTTSVVLLDCAPNTSVVSIDCTEETPNTSVVSIDCIEETPNTTSVVLLDCAPNTSVVSIDCTEVTPNTSVVSLDCTEETRNTSVGCLIKI